MTGPGSVPVALDDPALREGGLEAWRVDLDASREPPQEAVADLDEAERARLARFHRVGDRARFACVRSTLRRRLGARLGLPAPAVPIRTDASGKPCLPDDAFWFSVAHSGDHGLIALHARPVGVDIEEARDYGDLEGLADAILSAAERPVWLAERPERRPALLLRAWTAKEALLKAAGSGLLGDPKALTVLAGDGALTVRGERRRLGFDPAGAILRALSAPAGYAAALAVLAAR